MSSGRQLQQAAKFLVAAAAEGRSVLSILKEKCPHIVRQILQDGQYPGLLSFWGRSVNVDENTGEIIVHPAIVKAIGELAGMRMAGRVVHAGLLHTYCYLFSLIETPYGSKRDRWVSPAWERGFGIEHSLLSDRPRKGTLLANATWFLGKIVYRDRPRMLRRLEGNAFGVAPALVGYDFDRLRVCRIVESIVVEGSSEREVRLLTDLVPFPTPGDPQAENTLLIYSTQNGTKSPLKLVTAFPVRSTVVRDLTQSVPRRGTVDIRLRYNAYLPGLPGRPLKGGRYFADPHVKIE